MRARRLHLEPGAEEFLKANVAPHLHDGLLRYAEDGIEPGGFLCAVIENDLFGAVGRSMMTGDPRVVRDPAVGVVRGTDLVGIVEFLYNFCPSASHGSREKRLAWQASQQLASAEEAAERLGGRSYAEACQAQSDEEHEKYGIDQ